MKSNKWFILIMVVSLLLINFNTVAAQANPQDQVITGVEQTNTKTNSNVQSKTSNSLTFGDWIIPVTLVSTGISALITIIMYFLGRRNVKRQIKFDLALKNLLPQVYIPLIAELKKKENKGINIDFKIIRNIIVDNQVYIIFTPKKTKEILNSLHTVCNSINNASDYEANENEMILHLRNLEKQISKRFGALKG